MRRTCSRESESWSIALTDGREFFTAELGAKQLGLLRENECWASCFWAIQVTIAAASRHREYKTHV